MAKSSTVEEPLMTEEPTKEAVELSKEELAERRKEITDYYKENIKHLKIQLEYEELLMNIEKTRAERIQAQMFLAQATMGQQQNDTNAAAAEAFAAAQAAHDLEEDVPTKRKLKRT